MYHICLSENDRNQTDTVGLFSADGRDRPILLVQGAGAFRLLNLGETGELVAGYRESVCHDHGRFSDSGDH